MKDLFGFKPGSKKTTIRTETRSVPSPKPSASASPVVSNGNKTVVPSRPLNRPPPAAKPPAAKPPATAPAPKPVANGTPKSRHTQLRHAQKRKSASPMPKLQSDSEGDSDVPEEPIPKRKKTATRFRLDRIGQIRDKSEQMDVQDSTKLIQSVDLVRAEKETQFMPLLTTGDGSVTSLNLQYPGATQQETFQLVYPKESDGYRPLEDMVECIEAVLRHYIPDDLAAPLRDDSSGLRRRILRAINNERLQPSEKNEEIRAAVNEFNALVAKCRADGSINKQLDGMESVPQDLLKRVLDQIYARTVSPHVELLRQYKAASDNVYGELLASFVSMIFQEAKLEPSSVFLDLGSGVGNVVLQAALEVGCESHGMEVMANACAAARTQEQEFKPRCRLWGLSTGSINLMEGNFLTDERLGPILRRADVVLVNNQAFQPELNAKLKDLLLDLKEGARLVSLKTFVSEELSERNRNEVTAGLEVREMHYYGGYVSWKHEGGSYFIATKDSSRIEERLRANRRRGR